MEKLTKQQARVLEIIRKSINLNGYPPSVRELGESLGLRSTATVHSHLRNLERKGYLRKDAQKSRAFHIVEKERKSSDVVMVPIVGTVRAGMPVLAVENIEDVIPFPRALIKNEDVYLLRVEGDSMRDVGIFHGDYVLVRRQDFADNGDVVVALVDDEATVKTFYKHEDHIRLQPENSTMEPIITTSVMILGKVIGLYRGIK
jgi:repressor LexA